MILSLSTRDELTNFQAQLVNNGFFNIYNINDILLCSIQLKHKAFNNSTGGTARLDVNGGLYSIPILNGTASYFNMCDYENNIKWNGLFGLTSSDAEAKISSLTIDTNIPVSIISYALTTPSGEI